MGEFIIDASKFEIGINLVGNQFSVFQDLTKGLLKFVHVKIIIAKAEKVFYINNSIQEFLIKFVLDDF